MLYIFTEDFFFRAKLKNIVKKFLGRQGRGPEAVLNSLRRGLAELHVDYVLNQQISGQIDTAFVLSGPTTLEWAIGQKRKGKIKKLIAGPNIVVTPLDFDRLILSPEIDRYVVPAQWSIDWWVSLAPELKTKLALWPAGVEDRGEHGNSQGPILLFQKITQGMPLALQKEAQAVSVAVQESLKRLSLDFQIVNYSDNLGQSEFFKKISGSKFVIYLSTNESQGLALHEAWMADLPTLVWNRQKFEYKDFVWQDAKLSAPYLDAAAGIFFSGQEDFEEKLDKFLDNYQNFSPREYSLRNFTDKICAQKYLDLIHLL